MLTAYAILKTRKTIRLIQKSGEQIIFTVPDGFDLKDWFDRNAQRLGECGVVNVKEYDFDAKGSE